jgi:hypothetical protein
MSTNARLVYNFISAHPGYLSSQITNGVLAHAPNAKRGSIASIISRLKLAGFISASPHPSAPNSKKKDVYRASKPFDEEAFAKYERERRTDKSIEVVKPAKRVTTPFRVVKTTKALHQHSFVLRPNYTVLIALPSDFTSLEAQRLATFIQTLVLK